MAVAPQVLPPPRSSLLGYYLQTSNHEGKDMDEAQQKVKLKELSLIRVMTRDNAKLQNYINQSKEHAIRKSSRTLNSADAYTPLALI